MCGIVGALAARPVAPLLVEALKRLEYRGYDSAGIATLHDGVMSRRRAAGKLAALEAAVAADPPPGRAGIGHTRWATHGAPTEANAHPHKAGRVAVVHNGIVENFRALREEMAAAGRRFESDTDTEAVAALCAHLMAQGMSPVEAAAATLGRLRGAFALCFLFEGEEDLLVCARAGSPLALGYGEGEMFVGSDALALAPWTSRIAYLEEGDRAVVTRAGAQVFDAAGRRVERPIREVPLSAAMVGKDGHPHFMAKEIAEQPGVVAYALAANLSDDHRRIASPAEAIAWERVSRVTLTACGTAHYAAQVAKYWFEGVARLPAEVDIASEFRYRAPPLPAGGVTVVVSQSGETADTLAALRYAKAAGQIVVAVVNVETSTMAREADLVLPIHAGPEIGVASTKAFTAQLVALAAMAIHAARRRGAVDAAGEARLVAALSSAPRGLADAIALSPEFERLAADLSPARSVLYLGRGTMFPLALEAALKFKELTYVHAEGYAAGELKHGPIALVDESLPAIAFAPHDALFEKTVSNLHEVMARKGRVALISDAAGVAEAAGRLWRTVTMPTVDPFVAPIVYAAPAQLIAYHAAVLRGADVDQPRNLAKSVTVE
jgi:glucosamine--fructose-6-phosphate aminotransferase (isomerizing)